MRYYKLLDGGYILAIGTGDGYAEITKAEYDEINDVIQNKPQPTDTMDYRLRNDLTWEPYEVEPPDPDDSTVEDKAEAYDILIGEVE